LALDKSYEQLKNQDVMKLEMQRQKNKAVSFLENDKTILI